MPKMNKFEPLIADTDFTALELHDFQWSYFRFIPFKHEKVWNHL